MGRATQLNYAKSDYKSLLFEFRTISLLRWLDNWWVWVGEGLGKSCF